MIARNNAKQQKDSWQQLMADGISSPVALLELLRIDPSQMNDHAWLAHQQFATRVPHSFVARMTKGDIADPLLRQVLPVKAEMEVVAGYTVDPLQEQAANINALPGLLHKYNGRVLLTLTGGCAIHCRYCFRRHFPYQSNNPGKRGWQAVIDYIASDTSIAEVIYSGGDPLLLPDDYLTELTQNIATIPHIKTLRIHSRIPIVLPERITSHFIDFLAAIPLNKVLVLHCNHPNEINQDVIRAIQPLRTFPITLLNQTVLLKRINDNSDSLIQLSHKLFTAGILPYYLHLLDKVAGAAHFAVSLEQAQSIMKTLLASLPGYLVPKLVREEAGIAHKQPQNIF